jgi:hypothetical protein
MITALPPGGTDVFVEQGGTGRRLIAFKASRRHLYKFQLQLRRASLRSLIAKSHQSNRQLD